jgi:uncharacterized SAM-dependent methyltransferase
MEEQAVPRQKSAEEILRDRDRAQRDYEEALRKVREQEHVRRKPAARASTLGNFLPKACRQTL